MAVFVLLVSLGSSAQAYIDPATGSLVAQLLSAMALGGLLFIRRFREWIKDMLAPLLEIFKRPKD